MSVQLTSLPQEVNELVLEHLEPADIISMRSTSKHFDLATLDRFSKMPMVHRIHIWTHDGLQSLVKISARPQLLRRLERISILVLQPPPPPPKPASSRAARNGSKVLLHYNGLEKWKRWEQERVPDDETGFNGLTTIFRNMKQAGKYITVTMTTDPNTLVHPRPPPRIYGMQRLLDRLGHKTEAWHLDGGNSEPVCVSLVRAINKSRCRVRCLDIGKSYYTGLQRPQAFQSLRDGRASCWGWLVTLSVTLTTSRSSARDGDGVTCMLGFRELMQATWCLQRLEIHEPFMKPMEPDEFPRVRNFWMSIAEAVFYAHLTHLLVRNTTAPEDIYTNLLWSQRNSIQSLKMVSASHSEGHGWHKLFTVLLQAPNLDDIELRSLFNRDGSDIILLSRGWNAVQATLQREIANAVRPAAT
ncbi:hypothetical protein LTR56_021694 [Elasticomyces elasticus]|nr:hypothetical protein LTR56_021694 [Elasticomyces elasticus]KAK3664851.1 hypothetical protein LTR22_004441 [Elasticomyces elasticus]KAK4928660.1 hypothetical protein LTR49_004783 [Elasticomyces elasticus]KAK5765230.1 hypothetical protein LTS12_004744 [Elasticomyces elasticus]